MKREWKPGDVAKVSDDSEREYTALMDSAMNWRATRWIDPSEILAIRPLAVIDPEAAIPDEWLRVFYSAWMAADFGDEDEDHRAGLAALFAHIAAPSEPKPEEPMGDRATVRDRDGVLWTRDNNDTEWTWRDLCGLHATWAELDVPADGVLWGGVE